MKPNLVVVGAGIAGLSTALFAARAGADVALVEADPFEPPHHPDVALSQWRRPTVPQFAQGHNFHGLGRQVLREAVPDVFARLLEFGAVEREFWQQIPAHLRTPDDEWLTALQMRRPVLEWTLRRAVERERRVSWRTGVRVVGLSSSARGSAVVGVALGNGERIDTPWIVDAAGRRSALPRWLEALGLGPVPEQRRESNTIYFARHYRLRSGVDAPDGDWLFGPTGDLNYLRYSLLLEDAGHFVVTINIPASDRGLRVLHRVSSWDKAVSTFAPLRDWLRPGMCNPVSPVFAMGRLRNSMRDFTVLDPEDGAGILPIGDALCHTNPTQGWGASLALHHARRAVAAMTTAGDRVTGSAEARRHMTRHAEPLFCVASSEDAERARIASGEPPSWNRIDNPLFCRKVAYPHAHHDPRLFRAVQRRIHLLDGPDSLTGDSTLMELAAQLHHRYGIQAAGSSPPSLTRDEFLTVLGEPIGSSH